MRAVAVFVFMLLVFAGYAQAAEQPYRFGYGGRIATDVYINGQGPFAFLIDTASSRSLLFEQARARLGLSQSQPQRLTVYGIAGVSNAIAVKPATFTVAGETIQGLTLGVLPGEGWGGPDGVLGVDFLSRYIVVLDRVAMRFRLLPPDTDVAHLYAGWNETLLARRPFRNLPVSFWYLNVRFNSRQVSALFDLGADFTMLNWSAAEELGVREQAFVHLGLPPEALSDALGRKAPAVRLAGLGIRLPGWLWSNQPAVVADAPIFDDFNLGEKPAAIAGLGFLGGNSLAIDFQRGWLYVGPGANSNRNGGASAAFSIF